VNAPFIARAASLGRDGVGSAVARRPGGRKPAPACSSRLRRNSSMSDPFSTVDAHQGRCATDYTAAPRSRYSHRDKSTLTLSGSGA
jgi:hypothetical protein